MSVFYTNVPAVVQLNYLTTLTSPQQAAFEYAQGVINSIITQELEPVVIGSFGLTTKIIIDVSVITIDGSGGILGQAGPTSIRSGSLLPATGIMEFDSADINSLVSAGLADEVVLHELFHVLGIGTLWSPAYHNLITGAGTSNPQYIGPLAVAEYSLLKGTMQTSIPLENSMGAGSNDSHWKESTFDSELMTPQIETLANPYSRMTIAALDDLGYSVNYAVAQTYVLPPPLRAFSTATEPLWSCCSAQTDFSNLPVV